MPELPPDDADDAMLVDWMLSFPDVHAFLDFVGTLRRLDAPALRVLMDRLRAMVARKMPRRDAWYTAADIDLRLDLFEREASLAELHRKLVRLAMPFLQQHVLQAVLTAGLRDGR